MKTKNKIFFLIIFLFLFSLIGQKQVAEACTCNGTASVRCQLDEAVASGDQVYCSLIVDQSYCNYDYWCNLVYSNGTFCAGSSSSGGCYINPGSSSCSMGNLDCECSPIKVNQPWVSLGSLGFSGYSGSCSGYGYPYFSGGYYWLWTQNPNTCTLNFNYTPPSGGCTVSVPPWSSIGSSNITANSATLNWGLSSWGNECSCSGTREYETHLYSGSNCTGTHLNSWSFEVNPLTYSYNVTGLASGTTYSYFVWAMNKCYVSDSSTPNAFSASSCHSFTTLSGCPITSNPSNLKASNITATSAQLTWTLARGTYDSQVFRLGTDLDEVVAGCPGNQGRPACLIKTGDIGKNTTSLNTSSYATLQNNTLYYARVAAVNNTPSCYKDTAIPFTTGCLATYAWCANHGGIALTVPYDVSNWAQCFAWCNTSMSSSLPLCQYNADGPRNCWVNYAPAGGIANCTWNTSNPPYGAYWGGLTCPFPSSYSLSVTKAGTGSGTVTSSPSGINCGSTCSASYSYNTLVTLTATPATGSSFTGWGGDCNTSGQVTMTSGKSCTANFTLSNYTLTVTKAGTGSGTVTSSPSGINCGSTCSASYSYNTLVTLTATPATGSSFTGWGGDCNTSGQVTMTSGKSCTANFTLNTYTVSTSAGTGGTISPSSRTVSHGSTTTFTVTPNTGYSAAASGCSGSLVGTTYTTGAITAACTVTATFTLTNQPPVANFSCSPSSCSIYTNEILTLNNGSTDDGGIILTKWNILNWGLDIDKSCVGKCDYAFQGSSVGLGPHTANLYVEDAAGASNSKEHSFTVLQGASADFKCSLVENSNWQSCANFHAQFGAKVYFQDQSTASEGASISSRAWAFTNGIPATVTGNILNPLTRFYSIGTKQVSLTVTDTTSRSASKSYNLQIDISFPKWEEIAPF